MLLIMYFLIKLFGTIDVPTCLINERTLPLSASEKQSDFKSKFSSSVLRENEVANV